MKLNRLFCVSALIVAANAALAVGSATVQAGGGSVSGINTSGSGGWSGLTQTAYNATINYGAPSGSPSSFKLRQGDPSTQTGQQGTPVNNNGFANTSADGKTVTSGKGTVTPGTNGAPTYYDAAWQTTSSSGTTGTTFGSGTYDPWGVYARDVMALGTGLGGTADLYYQATLFGGRGTLTGFNLAPGQAGKYSFDIGNTDVNGPSLVSLDVFSNDTFDAKLNLQPKFEVYLLDPTVAASGSLTPYQKTDANHGATRLTSSAQLTSLLGGFGLQNGSFNRNLDFGILYRGFVLNTTDPNAVVFDWTTNNTQAAPEPAPMIALGLGALAMVRRRKRA